MVDPTSWALIKDGFEMLKGVLDVIKTTKDLAKDDNKVVELTEKIVKAESNIDAGKAQLAKALDYKLCQCTFPPQIMLSKGYHKVSAIEVFACDHCGKQVPSEAYFEDLARQVAEADALDIIKARL